MSGNYGRLKPATKRHNANISMAYGCTKDNNTYCYRLTNGHKHLHRIILGRGWEHTPFDVTKLSCYEGKGEESMKGKKAKEKPSDAELMAFAEKHNHANLVKRVKIEFHVGEPTARKWLMEAGLIQPRQEKICLKPIIVDENLRHEPQTPPEPPATNQSAQDATEPANKSIEPLTFEGNYFNPDDYIKAQPGDLNYTPTDNDYNEEPQRTTLTSAQYDAMLNDTEERQTTLQIYLENQSCESLLKRWAGEVFEHSGLSIERKLELIGQLLDWGTGA